MLSCLRFCVRPFSQSALSFAVLAWASTAFGGQSPGQPPEPAHVAYVDGAVTLEREGQTEAALVNAPLVPGDRLRTTAGRIEVLFPDGTTLDIDETSSADLLSPTLVRLTDGRALLAVAGVNDPSAAVRYQIDTPVASVRTDGPGEYRIAVLTGRNEQQTELAVVRGAATFATERGSTHVQAGERSVAFDNGAPSSPQLFNSARFDGFDRWSKERRDARIGSSSARYLPTELRTYGGALDRAGAWQYTESYGYVWYPSVAADWRPYYDGSWLSVPMYGWTWIGGDFWSWPTHHYGRWGHARGSWFWIPGRTWAPAWVSWATAPGYVSWCPLGFDGRSVFALSIGVANPWVGWVVVPRSSFGYRGFYAHNYSVAPRLIPRSTPFIVQSASPVPARRAAHTNIGTPPPSTGVAVRRPVAPSGVAVPRSTARSAEPAAGALSRSPAPDGSHAAASLNRPSVAVPRSTPMPDLPREFRRPLPEAFRAPSGDRATRAAPASSVLPTLRNVAPPAADRARYRKEGTRPIRPEPQSAPVPQAVPRWTPPREATPPVPHVPAAAPPARQTPGPPAPSYAPGTGGHHPSGDGPTNSQPGGAPHSQGSHQGGRRR